MKDRQKLFILNEPLHKVMWRLSIPAIVAMVLFGLNSFMDTVYIGQLMNETVLSGVAIAYPLTGILLGLGTWAGTGAANLLSIAIGDEDINTQAHILPNATLFAIISTVLVAVPAYFFAEPLIGMMGGEGDILVAGVTYFKVTMLASPLWVYGLMLNMIIRGEGKMKSAAVMMTYGLAANLILTPFFMAVMDLGVAGAAWATNISMAIYSIVGYGYFKKGKASFETDIHSFGYNKEVFRSVIKMGLPGFILAIMSLIQAIVVFNAIVNYGTEDDLAFFAAANRILFFLMTPLFGLMRSLQPVLGINYGAGQFDRVKQSFVLFTKVGFFLVAPFWLVLTCFPEASMRLMLPEMLFEAVDLVYIRIYMLVILVLPLVFMALTLFPAINEEKHASIIGLARQLVLYIPAMILLPRYFGVEWVYYGATLIDLVIVLWVLFLIIKLFKKLSISEKVNGKWV